MNYDNNRPPMAVILAAGIGSRLSPLTDKSAKSLLSVGGSVILERMIRNCLSCGMSQFVLVLGHRADEIKQFVDKTFRGIRVTYVINDRYRDTNTGYSLMLASTVVGTAEFIKFDADVVFDTKILRALVDSELPNVLCIDRNIALADEEVKVITDDQMRVREIGKTVDPKTALGESIGIEKISAFTGPLLFAELKEMMENAGNAQEYYEAAYARLIAKGMPFHALDITGMNWTEIDTPEDFATANALFGTPIATVSRGQQRALDEARTNPRRSI
ncbi:sugar phosphate nucleotidyltransferase [Puniceibacterium sp. IMCC21224]|uniref:phosphocholine cytidylyltransferase family protein n=1 Tax=Puniceibacterium sp. IMCC21224 TaxID=1618204 RepID=UPI00064DEAD2|nr:phosphocholine cytidylyltransferase family protein [Puniceibacterium sp. IMCC21224]KMK63777.1 putative sugar nucleotidyltransferase [Puniceibacterium sp. IMCC21224]KMK63811.1 putative sugar nucleotidyltransferase [Puniceibacterium sp. IMCC21224]